MRLQHSNTHQVTIELHDMLFDVEFKHFSACRDEPECFEIYKFFNKFISREMLLSIEENNQDLIKELCLEQMRKGEAA